MKASLSRYTWHIPEDVIELISVYIPLQVSVNCSEVVCVCDCDVSVGKVLGQSILLWLIETFDIHTTTH